MSPTARADEPPQVRTAFNAPGSRAAALRRLDLFAAGPVTAYARTRNVDLGPGRRAGVSGLSAPIRHRLITEPEVVRTVLDRHPLPAVMKFVQEVFWRTYWKGWLELRPAVWSQYRQARDAAFGELARGGSRRVYERACEGRTGIDGFDAWVGELVSTGTLHNHARMWFASIWVHTLRLPWTLGADFFLRHLLDGDPASNTLSWRWVVGLHTPGKVYLARPDNIARCTGGRFNPQGLALRADVPPAPPAPAPQPLAALPPAPEGPAALLLTEEDLNPESLVDARVPIAGVAAADAAADRSPEPVCAAVRAYTREALHDALRRASAHWRCPAEPLADLSSDALIDWCARLGVRTTIAPYTPVGPAQQRLHAMAPRLAAPGIGLFRVRRPFDEVCWPLATRGYFSFAARIPQLLADPRMRLSPGPAPVARALPPATGGPRPRRPIPDG